MEIAEFLLARYGEHLARCWERGTEPGSRFVHDEYEALSRIVELHKETLIEHFDLEFGSDPYTALCAVDNDDFPCATLRLLALPYADHSDYREEWWL